ncbi:MAG: CehA/McbA family metallohydrolase [Anaerolineae bacterium]|nr:CehA/McbA family metallohydrolase [Anaerolineae bacterium]
MSIAPFSKPGRFYRGNLHTHSTLSDGKLEPEVVCRAYQEAGYDFMALTDHFMQQFNYPVADTRTYRSDSFTTLLGAELHAGRTELGELWHILAVGLPLDFTPPVPDETGPQIAARALEAGAFVAAAHPQWYGLTEADILSLGPVHAIEVFNGTSIDHNDRPDSWYITDILFRRGHHYSVCATDDAHFNPDRADFQRGWVWVKSESLEPDALLDALKAGDYYSSTGPQIHDIEVVPGDKVVVRCSPAARIFVTGAGPSAMSVHGPGIRGAELSLQRFRSPYLRVVVRDLRGQCAWSNPVWLENE